MSRFKCKQCHQRACLGGNGEGACGDSLCSETDALLSRQKNNRRLNNADAVRLAELRAAVMEWS